VRGAGFDQSQTMIDFARSRCDASVRLAVAEMENFSAHFTGQRFALAYNLINTIRHLGSDTAMLAHLAQMHDVLSDDGIYIVGISRSDYGGEEISEDRWNGERDDCLVTQWLQYIPPQDRTEAGRFESVISHLQAQSGNTFEHFDSSYKLRCYDHAQWVQLIGKSRLEIREICDINGEPGDDDIYVLYVLGRRASLITR
jgi:SAM-dependent methyltransferase